MQKGGCGKSTTVQALAGCLTDSGYKCLVIDLDPQGNLSFSSEVKKSNWTIYELLKDECKFEDAVQLNKYYDIIPSSFKLSSADQEFNENRLREVLRKKKRMYDFILLDTPPSLGVLSRSSLVAADYTIIPVIQSFYIYQDLNQLIETIHSVQVNYNRNLKILGMLFIKYTEKAAIYRLLSVLLRKTAQQMDIPVFDQYIRECAAISMAQGMQKNILECDYNSKASYDYLAFTTDMLDWLESDIYQRLEVKKAIG